MSTSNQRQAGATLGYLAILVSATVAFILTPVVIGFLGKEIYGIYVLALSFTAYLNLLDMGMNEAVTRFLVSARREDDRRKFEDTLGNAFAVYGLLALAAVVVGAVLVPYLPLAFGDTMDQEQQFLLQILVAVVVGNAAITLLLNPAGAVLAVEERWILLRILEMIGSAGSALAGVATLYLGGDATSLVIATVVVNASVQLVKAYTVFFVRGWRPRRAGVSRGAMIRNFTYSAPILVVILVSIIYWKLDYLLIAALLGPGAVAVFSIGFTFQKYLQAFATAISRVMVPSMLSAVERDPSPEALSQQLLRSSRPQAMVLTLVATGIILFGREFILLWVGPEYELAYWVMAITAVPFAIESIGNLRNVILQAKGLYWYRAGIGLAAGVLKVGITVALLDRFGIVGAAVATSLGLLLTYVLVTGFMWHTRTLALRKFFLGTFGRLPFVLLVAIPTGLVLNSVPGSNWPIFAFRVSSYSLVFGLLIYALAITPHERQAVRGARRFLRGTK